MKFRTQYDIKDCDEFVTEAGNPIEPIYELKYMDSGEPYLQYTGRDRDVNEEIQKANVFLVDVATMYERYLAGEDCLDVVYGGEYLDISVFADNMVENANQAYQKSREELNNKKSAVVTDTEVKESEKTE